MHHANMGFSRGRFGIDIFEKSRDLTGHALKELIPFGGHCAVARNDGKSESQQQQRGRLGNGLCFRNECRKFCKMHFPKIIICVYNSCLTAAVAVEHRRSTTQIVTPHGEIGCVNCTVAIEVARNGWWQVELKQQTVEIGKAVWNR